MIYEGLANKVPKKFEMLNRLYRLLQDLSRLATGFGALCWPAEKEHGGWYSKFLSASSFCLSVAEPRRRSLAKATHGIQLQGLHSTPPNK